ncbi:MAG: hypothetical protein MR902_02220 [Campylobacter sp.]|nr:hypothetical protein [Campylobacter sp.]
MLSDFLFDSAFPNGGYSHSFGLESYISWGDVSGVDSYQKWLEAYMLGIFAPSDGAVYTLACEFKDKPLSLLKLARAANASISSLENHQAAIMMARATLKNTEFMHDDTLKWYNKVATNDKFASPAIVFALLSGTNMLDQYAYATIKTLTQNATRAIPLAYKKSNELIHKNANLAKISAQKANLVAKDIIDKGFFSLNHSFKIFASHHELDIAMFSHESVSFRLFMS